MAKAINAHGDKRVAPRAKEEAPTRCFGALRRGKITSHDSRWSRRSYFASAPMISDSFKEAQPNSVV